MRIRWNDGFISVFYSRRTSISSKSNELKCLYSNFIPNLKMAYHWQYTIYLPPAKCPGQSQYHCCRDFDDVKNAIDLYNSRHIQVYLCTYVHDTFIALHILSLHFCFRKPVNAIQTKHATTPQYDLIANCEQEHSPISRCFKAPKHAA